MQVRYFLSITFLILWHSDAEEEFDNAAAVAGPSTAAGGNSTTTDAGDLPFFVRNLVKEVAFPRYVLSVLFFRSFWTRTTTKIRRL